MWRIKLSRWKQIPAIFLYIILSAVPAAQATQHGRFLKGMMKTTSSYLGLEGGGKGWEVVDCVLGNFVKLQEWMRGDEVLTEGKEREQENGERKSGDGNRADKLEFLHIYQR